MIWEIDGVRTTERTIVEKLGDEYAHPTGIIVFGADSGLKAKAYKRLRSKLSGTLAFDRTGLDNYVGQIKAAFRRGGSVLICMSGEDSVHHGERYKLERRLYNLGAGSVVAVYADAVEGDAPDFAYLERTDTSHAKYHRHLKKLATDPPTYGGVDGFITVRQHVPEGSTASL